MANDLNLKKIVAYKAVDEYVKSNMIIGLGTGSTTKYAVERIGEKIKNKEIENIKGVPTSEDIKNYAESLNIEIVSLDDLLTETIDISIDGADEVCIKSLNLIKGRGGALLREKLVDTAAKKFIVIIDESKIMKDGLGATGNAIPVEVNKHYYKYIMNNILNLSSVRELDGTAELRMKQEEKGKKTPFVTDNENYIIDLHFKKSIKNVFNLASDIKNIVGVVEHGIFYDLTNVICLVSKADGSVYAL